MKENNYILYLDDFNIYKMNVKSSIFEEMADV